MISFHPEINQILDIVKANKHSGLWFQHITYCNPVEGKKARVRVAYSEESLFNSVQYVNPWWEVN